MNDESQMSNDHIAIAIIRTPTLLSAAKLLSEKYGFEVSRRTVAERVENTPVLKMISQLAQSAHDENGTALAVEVISKHAELRQHRNYGPRCLAIKRDDSICTRKVVLGSNRCASHGGLSTGPQTPAGKARSAAARARGLIARSKSV